MKKNILLTLDYELYGNGSGDVFKHIIEPTQRILHICNTYNAKITIFFEVIEYLRLKEEWERGNMMGYGMNPTKAMENQLQEAYKKGHDVQLHLHPQWVDAKWIHGEWVVNNEDWRLGGYRKNNSIELYNLIKKGKETIEEIIKSVDSNYVCSTLRAGGYNIQPSDEIVKTVKGLGMKADCSIVPGAIEKGSLSQYDFSTIPLDKGFWECGNQLEHEGKLGIIEIPIVTFPIIRWKKYFSRERFFAIMNNRKSAINTFNAKTQEQDNKRSLFSKIAYFFQKEYMTWDFCLFSKSLHKEYISKISKQPQRFIFSIVGHPKSFVNGKGLTYLLKQLSKDYSFITITEFLNTQKNER
ncbi:MAG: hypothetical protein IJK87_01465 [Prevotella sp.]|nr:hypothetical protein [Prevotella sp.]